MSWMRRTPNVKVRRPRSEILLDPASWTRTKGARKPMWRCPDPGRPSNEFLIVKDAEDLYHVLIDANDPEMKERILPHIVGYEDSPKSARKAAYHFHKARG